MFCRKQRFRGAKMLCLGAITQDLQWPMDMRLGP